ncbi:hypothetical protein AB0D08_11305 [Kitasatospora sp. NPDC048540]|uniref:hypothetical protein n=1 Tax=unclassified Kitasatospora TaxID=2633591 RepID=UPI000539E0FA|nr:hypothetical protein [Kitasatospora sp. MBT63]
MPTEYAATPSAAAEPSEADPQNRARRESRTTDWDHVDPDDPAERFIPLRLPPDDRGRELWAVLDLRTRLWSAGTDGEVHLFALEHVARGHAVQLRNVIGRPLGADAPRRA